MKKITKKDLNHCDKVVVEILHVISLSSTDTIQLFALVDIVDNEITYQIHLIKNGTGNTYSRNTIEDALSLYNKLVEKESEKQFPYYSIPKIYEKLGLKNPFIFEREMSEKMREFNFSYPESVNRQTGRTTSEIVKNIFNLLVLKDKIDYIAIYARNKWTVDSIESTFKQFCDKLDVPYQHLKFLHSEQSLVGRDLDRVLVIVDHTFLEK
jgi:hypothetical protein